MELTSHNNDEQFNILESQIRENYGKIVYSHKTQEKCADILQKKNNILKSIQIILSAIITTGLLIRIFKGQDWALIISTILSAIQFGLITFLKDSVLGETIQKHSTAALELWNIRENYLSLLTDIKSRSISILEIQNKRDEWQRQLLKIYTGSPRTFNKAYQEARRALQISEELTFNDSEIDHLLPIELRKIKIDS